MWLVDKNWTTESGSQSLIRRLEIMKVLGGPTDSQHRVKRRLHNSWIGGRRKRRILR